MKIFLIYHINSHTDKKQCDETSHIKCLTYLSQNQCRQYHTEQRIYKAKDRYPGYIIPGKQH